MKPLTGKGIFTSTHQSSFAAPQPIGMADLVSDQNGASPATRLATASQKKHAIWVCITIAILTAILFPIAAMPWRAIPAFLPVYHTTVIIAYVITAHLIFGHYKATRSSALLYLSGGCLYTAGVLVAQFLSTPGIFVPQSQLYGGTQTVIWLWCFWHLGAALSMLLYTLSEWRKSRSLADDPEWLIRWFGIWLALMFGATIAAVTVFHDWLPILDINGNYHRITTLGIAPAIQAVLIATLLILWRGTGFRTVLQVWVGVALLALLFDNAITMLGTSRLSIGWYAGRFNALLSACVILLVYLREINRAYLTTIDDAKTLAASNALRTRRIGQLVAQRTDELKQVNDLLIEDIRARKEAEEALRQSRSKLRKLADHQERVKEDERKRIAREIHDELGQNLMALRLDVSRMAMHPDSIAVTKDQVTAALNQIDTTIKAVRTIINDLRPGVLDLGLHAAVEWQAKEFERRSGIACELHIDHEEFALGDKRATALFRIVQESLTNVMRHAQASKVQIAMQRKDGKLFMKIADNGIGFCADYRKKTNTFGLTGIEERIYALGGTCSTTSDPGKGMSIMLSIPI